MDEKTSFHENPNDYLDTEMRFKALDRGTTSHNAKMADEKRLGVPAYDQSIAQDYIRNRVEPPADMVESRKIFKAESVEQPEGDYEKDLKKLKTLTSKQLDELLTAVRNESKKGRGLFSKGNLLNGYAIDRETLESLQTSDHDITDVNLAANISQRLNDSGDLDATIDTIKRRIVSGLVYLKVPGFKTPIVKLYLGLEEMGNLVPQKDVKKIVDYLKRERKLLPISLDFKTL